MGHIEIVFNNSSQEINEILIARLADMGYDGFEEEGDIMKAYINKPDFNRDELVELLRDFGVQFQIAELAETNWNKLWESNFQPVTVGDFCAVRADFHEPYNNIQHEIVITPKMSFGTGHHPTTYMMIEQMQTIDFNNKSAFDFGTGTGVLAILAKKMGASKVVAIDNDEWSITNAKENVANNNVEIDVQKADAIVSAEPFDVILANITKNVILENLASLVSSLKKNGILLLSGLLENDEDDILAAASNYQLSLVKKLQRNGWICLRCAFEKDH